MYTNTWMYALCYLYSLRELRIFSNALEASDAALRRAEHMTILRMATAVGVRFRRYLCTEATRRDRESQNGLRLATRRQITWSGMVYNIPNVIL